MPNTITRADSRTRRHLRVRRQISSGTPDCPRLSVFRSLRGMQAQLIDDASGRTLASIGIKEIDVKIDAGERKGKVADAYRIGYMLAQKAQEKKIGTVVFDRGGYQYHGRVQALAEGARAGGLAF
ncbi:MAG: 50S ribosomal protein L18 [Patescibacteria group bacterium]